MNDFIKIAQDNYIQAQKENQLLQKMKRQDAFWNGFCGGVEKAIIATCTVSLVLDAILLISLALDRIMH